MLQSFVSFFNLSGETITLNNTVSSSLSSEYWAPQNQLSLSNSQTPVQSLIFSRDAGLTEGDVYNLASAFELDGVALQFEVQLTGTAAGSDMQQCITAGSNNSTGWWATGDTMTLMFTGQSGTPYSIQVTPVLPLPFVSYAFFTLTISRNVLTPGMRLNIGDQLNSPGGLLRLVLEEAGLVVYRSMFSYPLWTSPNSQEVTGAMMQADGNFVLYNIDYPVWSTGTSGTNNLMLTDNELIVSEQSSPSNILWNAEVPPQDWSAATFQYDENGYDFDETSESWKLMCQKLPCGKDLSWPDYETTTFNAVLDGQPVVIQAWRGWCENFLGSSSFPGGIGGEVGVYTMQPALSPAFTDMWFPIPYVVASVSFQLINTDNGETVFFESFTEDTYWNCKWMTLPSYTNYQNAVGNYPLLSCNYQMNIQVTGIDGSQFSTTWQAV